MTTESTDASVSPTEDTPTKLRGLLERHWNPPREIVAKIPKGGVQLDYVGHADVTRIFIEEDPCWSWEPAAWTPEGEPLVTDTGKHYRMWGYVTIHGVRRLGVGTCEKNKGEWEKELVGDLLRNVGMRFGLAGALWSKSERSAPKAARAARPVQPMSTGIAAGDAKRALLEAAGGDRDIARQVWADAVGDARSLEPRELERICSLAAQAAGDLADTAPMELAETGEGA